MSVEQKKTESGNQAEFTYNQSEDILNNLLRVLSMLEKALNRAVRLNYVDRGQYPESYIQIEDDLKTLREWIRINRIFLNLQNFALALGRRFKAFALLVQEFLAIVRPSPGKRLSKKSQYEKQSQRIQQSIEAMLPNIDEHIKNTEINDDTLQILLEERFSEAEIASLISEIGKNSHASLSRRGEKSYIIPCHDPDEYLVLIHDRERFRVKMMDYLTECSHATGHRPGCAGAKKYKLGGFRRNPRKTTMVGGNQETFPIQMVKCMNCGQRFSLLPSFLPREKHFGIEIIGNVLQNLLLFSQSFQGVMETLKTMVGGIKSKQTIFNWLRWAGTIHPATILTRAHVQGSGYFQEDEGFEKEPDLRTYSVVMVDPRYLLVWHADYVDHVDEVTLTRSFEKFLERVSFKVLGVTKDKWKPSTNALKSVFHRLWIGYCHRHCLKKFYETLLQYQKETKCSSNKVSRLYKVFKKILDTATSRRSLECKLKLLDEEAFEHPLLQARLLELKENATYYTVHNNREGITKTTSIVDNFLKGVKRKLRQVESFRDQTFARILFQGMANIRNFVPFLAGAKNAHKSPFMLAGGETFKLPWMQVMNIHNAFLFTENAF